MSDDDKIYVDAKQLHEATKSFCIRDAVIQCGKAAGHSRSPPAQSSYFGSMPSTLISRASGACLSIHSLPPPL